ncbi:BLUF domain-containing protein [Sphingomonas aerolata]|uniref:BLUF domain-containing protein n=1 Tax=Sphingomonas aerolata TaxID=185951 RepID=UPI003A5C7622
MVFSYLTVPASIQALEGDAAAVQAVMDRIAKDPRHYNISYFRPITTNCRQFGKWTTEYLDREIFAKEGDSLIV